MKLTGVAVLSNDEVPCCLQYTIETDTKWRTLLCRLTGYVGKHAVTLDIRREGAQWLLNGVEVPEVAGGNDNDLWFFPAAELFSHPRVCLPGGKRGPGRAAGVPFPPLPV